MTDLEAAIYHGRAKLRSLPMYSGKWYELNTALAELTRVWRMANTLKGVS